MRRSRPTTSRTSTLRTRSSSASLGPCSMQRRSQAIGRLRPTVVQVGDGSSGDNDASRASAPLAATTHGEREEHAHIASITDDAIPVSVQLERWLEGPGDKTLGDLTDFFGTRGFALLFV